MKDEKKVKKNNTKKIDKEVALFHESIEIIRPLKKFI